jgi:hypothetical protein
MHLADLVGPFGATNPTKNENANKDLNDNPKVRVDILLIAAVNLA